MSSGGAQPQTPAFQQLTANNRGPVVIVASYIFLVISIVVVFTRLITRFRVSRRFAIDDFLVLIATIVLIGQTLAVTFAVNDGLGRHRDALSDAAFDRYAKAFYAARVLSILILALAKSSTNYLIMGIKPPRPIMLVCQATLIVTNVWALGALLAVLFECSPPRVWDYRGQCVDQWALYLSNAIWNISTDIALIVLPWLLMRNVQVSTQKRWVVIGLFGCRIIVPAFTIATVITTSQYWTSSQPDPTWYAVDSTLWTQAVINLSIITACIPCIKRFLADLSTGMMAVNISEPLEMTMKTASISAPTPNSTHRASIGFRSRLLSLSKNGSRNRKSIQSTSNESEKARQPQFVPPQGTRTAIIEKSESMDGLTDGVIVQTIDYEVNYEQARNGSQQEDGPDRIEAATSRTSGSLTPARVKDQR